MTDESAEQESSKPDSSLDARHWVEKLFPPHFTLEDLMKDVGSRSAKTRTSAAEPCPTTERFSETAEYHGRLKKQEIYLAALRDFHQGEEQLKRKILREQISWEAKETGKQHPIDVTDENPADSPSPDCNEEFHRGETSIWNEWDISQFRKAMCEVERDRRRLKMQLRYTEEKLNKELEKRKQLQELLDERENQLTFSRKQAAQQALLVKTLQTESQTKAIQINMLATEAKEKATEAAKWRTSLRNLKEETQQIKQECSNLAWEVQRLQEQQKSEMKRQTEAVRLEHEAAMQRLQREVMQVRAELSAERASHARSRNALELLRKHFNSQ
ncbi:coiled-coil domain-containing protein 160 homolog [Chanos chanos]|uniref:Coiled-coil domain-containing protein 160 homolog n=1 Tax=Chanos chanos TaxID=29144 RepID=A0A6J2UM63_CHACN|nr:coiled-coil domain-containing protein 160 [Chanos chanos]